MENALMVYVFRGTDMAVWTGQRNLGDEVIVVYEAIGVDVEAGSKNTVSYTRRAKHVYKPATFPYRGAASVASAAPRL